MKIALKLLAALLLAGVLAGCAGLTTNFEYPSPEHGQLDD